MPPSLAPMMIKAAERASAASANCSRCRRDSAWRPDPRPPGHRHRTRMPPSRARLQPPVRIQQIAGLLAGFISLKSSAGSPRRASLHCGEVGHRRADQRTIQTGDKDGGWLPERATGRPKWIRAKISLPTGRIDHRWVTTHPVGTAAGIGTSRHRPSSSLIIVAHHSHSPVIASAHRIAYRRRRPSRHRPPRWRHSGNQHSHSSHL